MEAAMPNQRLELRVKVVSGPIVQAEFTGRQQCAGCDPSDVAQLLLVWSPAERSAVHVSGIARRAGLQPGSGRYPPQSWLNLIKLLVTVS